MEVLASLAKNPKTLAELNKLGIKTIPDLLFYFPYRYEDFSELVDIIDIEEGKNVSIKGVINQIKSIKGFRSHPSRAEAVVSDRTGSIKVVWFNQFYLADTFKSGDEIFLAGTARQYKSLLQLQNPIYEKVEPEKENVHTARILPIYRLAANLPLRTLRNLIFEALQFLPEIEETLPEELLTDLNLLDLQTTIKNLHFPENPELLQEAKKRAAFEEIFANILAVQKRKLELQQQRAPQIPFNKFLVQNFVNELPFELTADQKRAAWEILQDLEQTVPMNRLLEGDVGSGKTLVAFIAALQVTDQRRQAALLCPTEILAEQHYASALKYFEHRPQISLVLLTSKNSKINGAKVTKKRVLEELAHGGPQFVISTHAILQKSVEFKNLALVIIDEQHRFGVRQRAGLLQKTARHNPHLLSMTATPIPRTLKLTLFGDLEISQISHLPRNRKPILTKLTEHWQREKAYAFIKQQLQQGRQAFVVTPLIEENDRLGIKAATTEYENLRKVFREFKVGLLHGKIPAPQKEKTMQEFLANKSQVLVSTSVIEVGVDVPNATVIVIEGAERFGLAQLHQFRGRVGRAEHQSYCLLFTSENESGKALSRLEKFTKIQNGFELAELDLQYRGFGNIYGEEQSGFLTFKYFSFSEHGDLAEQAKLWAKKILDEDPKLKHHPILQARLADKVVHLE